MQNFLLQLHSREEKQNQPYREAGPLLPETQHAVRRRSHRHHFQGTAGWSVCPVDGATTQQDDAGRNEKFSFSCTVALISSCFGGVWSVSG